LQDPITPHDEEESKKLLNSLRKGKGLQTKTGQQLRENYLLEGKLIVDWEKDFIITIPVDPSPAECRQLLAAISNKYQDASRLMRECQLRKSSLTSVYNSSYTRVFLEVLAESKANPGGGRGPSKEVLEQKAKEKVMEYQDAIRHAEIAFNFFKGICDKLNHDRETLKSIIITHGTEAKLVGALS